MTASASGALADARLAARLCARDPRLGGMLLRGAGAVREAALGEMLTALPAGAPVRRLPANADAEVLLGGLDLASALGGGEARLRPGLLGMVDGGLMIVPMAERLTESATASLGNALDQGEVMVERDGTSAAMPARFVVVAFDDGAEDERVSPALGERLAFWLSPDTSGDPEFDDEKAAVSIGAEMVADGDAIALLAGAAAALGIDSARAGLFALRTARGAAALDSRDALSEADLGTAVRLVLAPRATRMPEMEEDAVRSTPPPEQQKKEEQGRDGDRIDDRLIEAARAALPADLLAALVRGRDGSRAAGQRARGAGERRRSVARGRPAGVRAGKPRGGARLALIETLRASAPWQRLRGRGDRMLLRQQDLRIRRYQARATPATIVAVDASGSAATARLAEAKGAIELLLSRAYVQRAEVALVAFRGMTAELLLPLTRSLARARRVLAELPGGGGTPLARGIEVASAVAITARAKGRTPFLVVLSDGRANIAADGSAGRAAAERDALAIARSVRTSGLAAVFIDTGARPRLEGARIAEAMGGRYLPLPYAGAVGIEAAIGTLAPRHP